MPTPLGSGAPSSSWRAGPKKRYLGSNGRSASIPASRPALYLGIACYFRDRYSDAVVALDQAVSGNLGYNTQYAGRSVLAAAYAQLDRPRDAERERAIAMRIAPFLDTERFASQCGTQQAREKMLEGLKKVRFH
jgi:hypothetical protein